MPALVPGEGYDAMAIAEGGAASRALERILFEADLDARERDSLRDSLLRYCRQDTLAMVQLLGRLRSLAVTTE